MTVVVFSGPTLSPGAAAALFPEAVCKGPAARGDVLAAVDEQPRAICLIDGVFDHRPAVAHKEILWAMKCGIRAFGAGSMGALRAAELAEYGMKGRGDVFRRFMSGELQDDDEVAVVHAGAEHDYRPGSDALVNIRVTLEAAQHTGVASPELCARVLRQAKESFYAARDLGATAKLLLAAPESSPEHTLGRWLTDNAHWVDQKRGDAEALLTEVRALWLGGELTPMAVSWTFPYTSAWHALRLETHAYGARVSRQVAIVAGSPMQAEELESIVQEIQLLGPEMFAEIMLSASLCALTHALGPRQRTAATLSSHVDREAGAYGVSTVSEDSWRAALEQVPHILRKQGDETKVLARARRKRAAWQACGPNPVLPSAEALLSWDFETRLGRGVPEPVAHYAARLGFRSREHLLEAIAREFVYVHR